MNNINKDLFGDAVPPLIHDIRNPLNIIMGFSSILQMDDSLDEETKSHISKISFSAKQIENLLANIDFCMIDSIPYKTKSLSFSREIGRFSTTYSSLIMEKGLMITVDIHESEMITIPEEVLQNTLLNLIHFSIKGMRSKQEKPVYITGCTLEGKKAFLYCDQSDYYPIKQEFFTFEEVLAAKRGLYPLFVKNLITKCGGTVEYCSKEKMDSLPVNGNIPEDIGQGFLFSFS